MADAQHIQWLLEGVEAWNARREAGGDLHEVIPDFSGVNLRAEFENAGQVRGNEWIPLAGYDLIDAVLTLSVLNRADLVGADLVGADLTGADLTDADLTGAGLIVSVLNRADLTGADLTDADLTGANLTGADLTDADLTGADLTDANLTGADLTDANLTGTNLAIANLTTANLTRANLTDADLTGTNLKNATISSADCTCADLRYTNLTTANLAGAKIWQGILFANINESAILCPNMPDYVDSIKNMIDAVNKAKAYHNVNEDHSTIYFRGESKSMWPLQPSVMRDISYKTNERNMLFDLIARRPGDFNGIVSGVGQLVLAQHHGLKTRFLDITRNPLVALYHACEKRSHRDKDAKLHVFVTPRHMVKPFISDTVSVIANYARLPKHHQDALIGRHSDDNSSYFTALEQLFQLIQSEKPYFVNRIDPKDFYRIIVVEPQRSSERIIKQAGAFLVSAFHKRFESKEIAAQNKGVPPLYAHYQLTIPSGAKQKILDELEMLDITRETLFPSLDESAAAIKRAYRKRQE